MIWGSMILKDKQRNVFTNKNQVMGRHCGYLALVAALAAEADFCFIPEWPVPENWEDILCQKLQVKLKNSIAQLCNIC